MITKKNSLTTLLVMAMIALFSSCSVDQEEIVDNDEIKNLEIENENSLKANEFIPDPDKLYHISPLEDSRRIAANGNFSPFLTYSYGPMDEEVRWRFTPASIDGHFFIDCLGGRNRARMRTDNTTFTDMNSTSFDGAFSQWSISPAGDNTYFLTTNGGELNRLNLGRFRDLRMVSDDSETVNEQFIITEVVNPNNRAPIAQRDIRNFPVNKTIIVSVLDNDFDPDGDELTLTGAFGGSPNIVEILDGNRIQVTRRNSFGSTIYYNISDGKGGTAQSTITIFKIGGNNG